MREWIVRQLRKLADWIERPVVAEYQAFLRRLQQERSAMLPVERLALAEARLEAHLARAAADVDRPAVGIQPGLAAYRAKLHERIAEAAKLSAHRAQVVDRLGKSDPMLSQDAPPRELERAETIAIDGRACVWAPVDWHVAARECAVVRRNVPRLATHGHLRPDLERAGDDPAVFVAPALLAIDAAGGHLRAADLLTAGGEFGGGGASGSFDGGS